MDPFIIGVWGEKILLEPQMEVVIPRTVGVENVTTRSPGSLSGEIGSSQTSGSLLLTSVEFDCIGTLAALSPELVVFPGAASKDLQKLTEEPMAHQHLTRSLVGAIKKPGAGGRRQVKNE